MLDELRQAVNKRFETGEHGAHLFQQLCLQKRRFVLKNLQSFESSMYKGASEYRDYVRAKILLGKAYRNRVYALRCEGYDAADIIDFEIWYLEQKEKLARQRQCALDIMNGLEYESR